MIGNSLTIKINKRFSTTDVTDPANDLARIIIEQFTTQYPNGLYGPATFKIPRDVTRPFLFKGGNTVTIYNGLEVVYEGRLLNTSYTVDENSQYIGLEAAGDFGQLLGVTTINKRWADSRIGTHVWEEGSNAGTQNTKDRIFVTRAGGVLRIVPKSEVFAPNESYSLVYTMPTGRVIESITYDYDFDEDTQAWGIRFWDATNGSNYIATSTGSGTGITYTLGTAVQQLFFQFVSLSGGDQTPPGNGDVFGEISNVIVYGVSSPVTVNGVVTDIHGEMSNLNSDTSNIAANSLSIEPFVSNSQETAASLLKRVAAFGDSSQNSWAVYLREHEFAASPDGKPVLVLEQYPAISDYDYTVNVSGKNIAGSFELVKFDQGVVNWVTVEYVNDNGKRIIITPDDDATLKDTDSISTYGERHLTRPLQAGYTDAATAKLLAKRYLAYNKDAKFIVSGPITVKGWIATKRGALLPAARIRAGKRIKILDFIDDLAGEAGAGMTWLITRTVYNPARETCDIYTGSQFDDAGVLLAQIKQGIV